MVYWGMDVPKTHSIGHLFRLMEDAEKIKVPESLKEAAILTDYAVTTRYPGDWEAVTEEEYIKALTLAKEVYQWVSTITDKG